MTMASVSQVFSFILPVMTVSAGVYYLQRHFWPLGRTINKEWYDASEAYLNNMPRQASATPVRLNPGSAKISTKSLVFW